MSSLGLPLPRWVTRSGGSAVVPVCLDEPGILSRFSSDLKRVRKASLQKDYKDLRKSGAFAGP